MKLLPLATMTTTAAFLIVTASIASASPKLNSAAGNTDFSSFRDTNDNLDQSQSASSIAATVQATPSLSTLLAVAKFVSTNNDLVELLAKPGPIITDGQHRKTRISKVDIGASNGVVHLVDRVLLPS